MAVSPICLLSQTVEHPWNVGIHFGKSEFNGDIGDASFNWTKPYYGFGGFSVSRYATRTFDLMVNLNYGEIGYFADLDSIHYGNGMFHGSMYGTHANGTLFLKCKLNNGFIFKEKSRVQPYLLLGIGISFMWGDRIYDLYVNTNQGGRLNNTSKLSIAAKDQTITTGIGVNFVLSKRFNAYLQSSYIYTDHDGRDGYMVGNNDGYLLHQVGVTFNFGNALKPVVPKVECNCKMFDRDSDGIIDKFDLCPDVPGTIMARGCPDRDWDGIPDFQDSCPDVWGLLRFKGCPDTDGDGIPDYLDSCPLVSGPIQFNGCPDTDGDGIPDKLDSCPNVKGLKQFNGCPDTDGDGIPDKLDSCPTIYGLRQFNGCPDTDGDTLPDYLDKCPREAGPIWNHGCPEIKESVKKVFDQALKGIQFQTAKSIILAKSYPILDNVVKICLENPTYYFIINGHTDNQGDPIKNLKLSDDRANSVRLYLIKKGVSMGRVESHGYGDTQPIDNNNTPEGRSNNRRVEFKVKIMN